jgi:hypothetical protein
MANLSYKKYIHKLSVNNLSLKLVHIYTKILTRNRSAIITCILKNFYKKAVLFRLQSHKKAKPAKYFDLWHVHDNMKQILNMVINKLNIEQNYIFIHKGTLTRSFLCWSLVTRFAVPIFAVSVVTSLVLLALWAWEMQSHVHRLVLPSILVMGCKIAIVWYRYKLNIELSKILS